MKQQHYTLKIENPCEKDWNLMKGEDTARYCSHCSKSVIDFTQLTDNQILEKIKKTNGKICGRLTEKQLQQNFVISKQKSNNFLVTKFLSGLFLLGLVDNANGNEMKLGNEVVENRYLGKQEVQNIKESKTITKDSLKNVIEGQIINAETKEPLRLAKIIVKGHTLGAVTGENGNFSLIIPDSLIHKKITLVISSIGYEETEVIIKAKDLPILEKIFLVKVEECWMGEVIIVFKKKKWWEFWKRKHLLADKEAKTCN